ncbi:trigger factor [Lentisalinibacter sediminis]|uniref:trigger factor n=1 Tax=Lentisalinibacter sediminis TaxID=2992237 RepID=UPI0038678AFC
MSENMQVSVEATGNLERRLRVEVPAERINKEIENRLRRVGKTAKIKGFRPGKVPAKVIRQRYGDQVRQEVLSEMMQTSYSEALQRESLVPAGGPQIQPEKAGDEGLVYTATFEVYPEVELADLDKISVSRPVVEITPADVDQMMENLRRQKAEWETVERPAAEGDKVIVDFEGSIKGEPIENGKGEKIPVILGEGRMIEDFEKALTGVAAGDEKTFKVKYPKDYPAEDLAGKKAEFKAVVHEVQAQVLPPLDEELAKAYGVEEGGVEQLRADVEDNMRQELEGRIRADMKNQAMEGLLSNNPLEVPEALVQQESQTLQKDAMQRMGIEDAEQAPPLESFREMAERRVRLGLLVQQLISDKDIQLDADRLRGKVEEMFAGYDQSEQLVSTYLGNQDFISRLGPVVLEEQAVEWLIDNGQTEEKKVPFKDYMQAP